MYRVFTNILFGVLLYYILFVQQLWMALVSEGALLNILYYYYVRRRFGSIPPLSFAYFMLGLSFNNHFRQTFSKKLTVYIWFNTYLLFNSALSVNYNMRSLVPQSLPEKMNLLLGWLLDKWIFINQVGGSDRNHSKWQ